tara:strand:- start:610 stop:1761 length:1152 start_codon:yes stop_codon:yes gene_type:complete
MTLTNADIVDLIAIRRDLHANPERSGQERQTARRIARALAPWRPQHVIPGLGGHGVAAVYDSGQDGPTVLVRSELDALPILELGNVPHVSTHPGTAHLCGHDGHSTILLGLARRLHRRAPRSGRVVLMFQPAEEDGTGAAAVLDDPGFAPLTPDWAFSLHNMPGVPLGHALIAPGPVNCASVGVKITLTGETAHASLPETGRAPTLAIARLIDGLQRLGPGGPMEPGFRLATITHLSMGEPAFGIAPGQAELWVTLRAVSDSELAGLVAQSESLARDQAAMQALHVSFSHHDPFAACFNHPDATAILCRALEASGVTHDPGDLPMRASEDFGRFGIRGAKAAMLFLGAGADHPALHTQSYDFPDDLIARGVAIFDHAIGQVLG